MAKTDAIAEIQALAAELARLVPHRFEVIASLEDGTAIQPEALSEDHTVGLYPYAARVPSTTGSRRLHYHLPFTIP